MPSFAQQLLLVGAPSLLARGEDLARLPWILDPADAYLAGLLRGAGLEAEDLALTGIADPLLELAAARSGYGLLFATDAVVRDDLAAGRLRSLPFPGLPGSSYWLLTPPGPRRPAPEDFLAWLKGQFATRQSGRARFT